MTRVFIVKDDEGWQAIYGEKQLTDFACERLSYGEVYGDIDEDRYNRILKEYEDTNTIKNIEDVVFIVKTDNWYLDEIEVH